MQHLPIVRETFHRPTFTRKGNLNRMKAFEFYICVLVYIPFTSSMYIISEFETQPNDQNVNQFMNTCIIEADMIYENGYNVKDIINDTIEKPELAEKTRKHGCFIECVLRKVHWMEGEELKVEKIYADVNDKIFANHPYKIQIEEFINDCVRKVKHTSPERCQRGVIAMKCGVKGVYGLFPSILNENEEDINAEGNGNN